MKGRGLLLLQVTLVLVVLMSACARGGRKPIDEEIFFQDPVLEQAVRNAQGYTGNPTGPIYKSDVLGITRLFYWGPLLVENLVLGITKTG